MVLTASPPKTDQSEAADRLIRVNILNGVPTTVADTVEFGYDALDRRTRIVEMHGSTILNDKTYLWIGGGIVEERDTRGIVVSKRYFGRGFQIASGDSQGSYYYSKDHLGSIREMTNTAGAVVAKYDYDLWGRQIRVSGTINADFGYTGFYFSRSTDLNLTHFRVYNPEIARWLSRDSIGDDKGLNLYEFVNNSPAEFVDRDGKQAIPPQAIQAWQMLYNYAAELCPGAEGWLAEHSQEIWEQLERSEIYEMTIDSAMETMRELFGHCPPPPEKCSASPKPCKYPQPTPQPVPTPTPRPNK